MRVVILTALPFWHPGTSELIFELRRKNIEVLALDIFHGKVSRNESLDLESLIPFNWGKSLDKVYMKLFRRRIIRNVLRAGDIVDIHFVEAYYSKYIRSIQSKGVKIIATLFGSDLYRTNPEQKKMQQIVFESSEAIILSENMVEYFEKFFPGFSGLYHYNQYGSSRLDLISQMKRTMDRDALREKYGIKTGQIAITCGYNAKKEQQHIKLLEQIEKLPQYLKDKISLIFPVTYGHNKIYLSDLKRQLDETGLFYLWFEHRLSENELSETKIISDITINTQTTDALASSIKEAMVADDVLLLGNWLPYDIYTDLNVFFERCSWDSLTNQLMVILDKFDEFKENSKGNEKIIMDFAAWRNVINQWVKLYKTIHNGR